jgi:hypothetical protein
MLGIMAFSFRDYVRSYRYIGPMLVFGLALFFIYNVVPNPVMPSYSLTAALLFLIASWLGFGYVDAQDETQHMIGMLHAGGRTRYDIGRTAVMVVWTAVMSVITVVYPILLGKFDRDPSIGEALSSLLGHAGMGMLGIAVSCLFTYRLISKLSYAIIGLMLVSALSLAAGGIAEALPGSLAWLSWLLPPVFPLIDAFDRYEKLTLAYRTAVLIAPWVYGAALFGIFHRLPAVKKL